MIKLHEQFIDAIRAVVLACPSTENFESVDWEELYNLSKNHDMAHLINRFIEGKSLAINEVLETKFHQQYYLAVNRVALIEHEYENLCSFFESEKIDFVPLKGAVVRKLYPQNWMRVSSDIDVLVQRNDLDRAEELLQKNLNYNIQMKSSYDDVLIAPNGTVVELHFELSDNTDSRAGSILKEVWNYCQKTHIRKNAYEMVDEFLYFYHIYHMAKHFREGGCGVRSLLDTWILNHRLEYEKEHREELLRQGGMLDFAKAMEAISEKWFSQTENQVNCLAEQYILAGGAFGFEQHIAAKQAQKGNRRKFVFARLFPSKESLYYKYPALEKKPFLLPFCWGHRLLKELFQKKAVTAKHEINLSKKNESYSREITDMFEDLGIMKY